MNRLANRLAVIWLSSVALLRCSSGAEFESLADTTARGDASTAKPPVTEDAGAQIDIPPEETPRAAPPSYRLPWACGEGHRVTAGNYDFHHTAPDGQFAWDFSMTKDTAVLAARGGTVSSVRDGTRAGDPCYNGCIGKNLDTCCPVCGPRANVVTIDHGDGTFGRYVHLESVGVELGDVVGQGQELGHAGTTGCSTGVHLHFEVVRKNGFSVEIQFDEAKIPKRGETPDSGNACSPDAPSPP